ncbi:hypothetical protein MRX96_043710 [Rhipicephalus microplus]
MVKPPNPWMARVLDYNMDLQVILDHYACATYVVDYVNKADRGMSNLHNAVMQIIEEKPGNGLRHHHTFTRRNDAQESRNVCARRRLGFSCGKTCSKKSRDVVYILTCYPEERVRVHKTNQELVNVSAALTDVWKLNIIQTY